MCNSDDRRQWRKQGGAVGAAASRMRAAAKQTLGAATRLSAATSFFPFRQLLRDYQGRAALDSCLPRLESSGCFSGSLLARKRELSPNAKAILPRATSAQCRFPFSHAPFCISYYAFDLFAASAILSCATSDGDTPGMRPACPKFFGRMRASFSRASNVRPVSSV